MHEVVLNKSAQNESSLNKFANFLNYHNKVLLVTHENPDSDGIGAMLGLAYYLRSMQKEVRIIVTPSFPTYLKFTDPNNLVEVFDNNTHKYLINWPDAWVLVDVFDSQRLGSLYTVFKASNAHKACLDHHLVESCNNQFDTKYINSSASASAELVYDLLVKKISTPLPITIANALYAGIVDDTGSFRYCNTTARIHRIAADLIDRGVQPQLIYQNLYHQGRIEKLRILARAFYGMASFSNNRYVRLSLTQNDLATYGVNLGDLSGLVNYPIELKEVEVSCLLYELVDGQIKVSLRSKGKVDVNQICKRFGGGGHKLASGAKLSGPITKAQADIDAAVLNILDNYL